MGCVSVEWDGNCDDDEKFVYEVMVDIFYMSVYEVINV